MHVEACLTGMWELKTCYQQDIVVAFHYSFKGNNLQPHSTHPSHVLPYILHSVILYMYVREHFISLALSFYTMLRS